MTSALDQRVSREMTAGIFYCTHHTGKVPNIFLFIYICDTWSLIVDACHTAVCVIGFVGQAI